MFDARLHADFIERFPSLRLGERRRSRNRFWRRFWRMSGHVPSLSYRYSCESSQDLGGSQSI